MLDKAFDEGINLINTSYYYSNGESEKILGNYFLTRKNRNKYTIVSKIHGDLSPSVIENCINQSLKRMNTDYIDYYGITFDNQTKLENILETMEKFIKQGKILKVACNNFDNKLLVKSKKIQEENNHSVFGMLETVYNILYRGIEKSIIKYFFFNFFILFNTILEKSVSPKNNPIILFRKRSTYWSLFVFLYKI